MQTNVPRISSALHAAPDRYVGRVSIESRRMQSSGRSLGLLTYLEPKARTAWHSSSFGRTLIVKTGRGRMQFHGQPPRELEEGDVIWIEPSAKHWYGASPTDDLTLFVIDQARDDDSIEWFGQVADEHYLSFHPHHGPSADERNRI